MNNKLRAALEEILLAGDEYNANDIRDIIRVALATPCDAPEQKPDLNAAIMNIVCPDDGPDKKYEYNRLARTAYKEGHRDARHAAAELVAQQ